MKFTPLLGSALVWMVSATALAQHPSPSKEAPPKPPLLAKAADDCQWTITYAPKTPEKTAATADDIRTRKMRERYSPLVLAKRILRSQGQMVIYTTYEANMKSEAWVVGNYIYELPFREGEGIRVDSKGYGDFPDIYWVSTENFRGTVELKKRKVQLYETDAPDPRTTSTLATPPQNPDPPKSATKPLLRRAYIDPETRLPVMVDNGTTVATYEFSALPADFPVMDERISQQLKSATE